MLETANTYISGTAARKLEYDVYEENKVLRTKKKYRSNSKVKMKLVGYTLIIFALFLTIMIRYAVITKVNYDINRESRIFSNLKDENIRLRVDIEKSLDLHAVRETAETRLGMQMPEEYQIVYIRVPKSDFTEVVEHHGNTPEKNLFGNIKEKIGNLVCLLG